MECKQPGFLSYHLIYMQLLRCEELQLDALCKQAMVYCYREFEVCYLEKLKLFSIRVLIIFEPIIWKGKKGHSILEVKCHQQVKGCPDLLKIENLPFFAITFNEMKKYRQWIHIVALFMACPWECQLDIDNVVQGIRNHSVLSSFQQVLTRYEKIVAIKVRS